uniref:Transmembrane protein n=1 Tax=Cacopsylla melanoneura TaxID=428564 RepID=A0A8D9A6B0_9HEMI
MNMLSPLPARRIRLDPNEHDPRVDQEKPPSRLGNKRCFFPEKGIGKGESGRERLSPFSILIISFYQFSINSFFLIIYYILLFSPTFPFLNEFVFPHNTYPFIFPFFNSPHILLFPRLSPLSIHFPSYILLFRLSILFS